LVTSGPGPPKLYNRPVKFEGGAVTEALRLAEPVEDDRKLEIVFEPERETEPETDPEALTTLDDGLELSAEL